MGWEKVATASGLMGLESDARSIALGWARAVWGGAVGVTVEEVVAVATTGILRRGGVLEGGAGWICAED